MAIHNNIQVKFNVGGKIFQTTTSTLANAGHNFFFGKMFDKNWNLHKPIILLMTMVITSSIGTQIVSQYSSTSSEQGSSICPSTSLKNSFTEKPCSTASLTTSALPNAANLMATDSDFHTPYGRCHRHPRQP
ncbi:BTB/POZ domain-containing protein [Camellia lanceoleosa]|uniref:BTB/POZ domain-containing protein n=1 Tax=Camellia lanceoleosa TaxID=1840588 RepID=A0ACC0I1B3_9ERIC|nr:BTB/POZ domain-containing protein [Camellia lanceoleosa]